MRPSNPQIALLGIRVDDVSLDAAASLIDGMMDSGVCHRVGTASAGFVSEAIGDQELRELLNACDLVITDGKPLLGWVARLMGGRIRHRVDGTKLLPRLLELCVSKKRRIFLMGATEEQTRCALEQIGREYPDADICGCGAPATEPLDSMANGAVLKLIEEFKPDLLIVGLGNSNQEKWLAMHDPSLRVPVCVGIGASAEFLSLGRSGEPVWMRRLGIGWMARRFHGQRRSGLGYLDGALFLLRALSMRLFMRSIRSKGSAAMKVSTATKGGALIVRVAGDFTGPGVCDLHKSLGSELASGSSLVMDLSSCGALRPDGAEFLAGLTHGMMDSGAQVWLAGIQPGVRKVLRTSFPEGHSLLIAATIQDALRALRARGESRGFGPPADYATPNEDWMLGSYEGRGLAPKGGRILQGQLPKRPEAREATAVD